MGWERSFRVTRARENDAKSLSEIAWEAKGWWGYPKEWMERWRDELTVTAEQIHSQEAWVVRDGSRLLGFYVLEPREDRSGTLEHLWVRPESMRKGIGSALLQHALRRAKTLSLETVSIVSDPNAEPFYVKHGAVRVGMQKGSVGTTGRELPVLTISPG